MKIIKHGKFHNKIASFCCPRCNCEFEAQAGECKVTLDWALYICSVSCPECGFEVFSQIKQVDE